MVKVMYHNINKVKSQDNPSREFAVEIGVYQGSPISPLLFNTVMNYFTTVLNIRGLILGDVLHKAISLLVDKNEKVLPNSIRKPSYPTLKPVLTRRNTE